MPVWDRRRHTCDIRRRRAVKTRRSGVVRLKDSHVVAPVGASIAEEHANLVRPVGQVDEKCSVRCVIQVQIHRRTGAAIAAANHPGGPAVTKRRAIRRGVGNERVTALDGRSRGAEFEMRREGRRQRRGGGRNGISGVTTVVISPHAVRIARAAGQGSILIVRRARRNRGDLRPGAARADFPLNQNALGVRGVVLPGEAPLRLIRSVPIPISAHPPRST